MKLATTYTDCQTVALERIYDKVPEYPPAILIAYVESSSYLLRKYFEKTKVG